MQRILFGASCLLIMVSLFVSSCSNSVPSSSTIEISTGQTAETTSTPTESIETTVSRDQALAIAAQQLPPNVILQSTIAIQLKPPGKFESHYFWNVAFDGFTITRDELIAFGWRAFTNVSLPNFPEYHVADINVDAETGIIESKGASIVRLGPMPTEALSEQPIEVISMLRHIPNPPNPGGPTIELILKNLSAKTVVSLSVLLGIKYSINIPFEIFFDVSASNPLTSGKTISGRRFLAGAGYEDGQYYPVFISGTFQDGLIFSYTQYVQVPKFLANS
jgi:hypothetical protein